MLHVDRDADDLAALSEVHPVTPFLDCFEQRVDVRAAIGCKVRLRRLLGAHDHAVSGLAVLVGFRVKLRNARAVGDEREVESETEDDATLAPLEQVVGVLDLLAST